MLVTEAGRKADKSVARLDPTPVVIDEPEAKILAHTMPSRCKPQILNFYKLLKFDGHLERKAKLPDSRALSLHQFSIEREEEYEPLDETRQ
jgi:hypothetical protein